MSLKFIGNGQGCKWFFLNYLFLATLVNNANEKTLTPL